MKRAGYTVACCIALYLVTGGCFAHNTVNDQRGKKQEAVSYSGGTGASYDSAVVITGAGDYAVAVTFEQHFIARLWGEKDKDWMIVEQTTITENGRMYDMVRIAVTKSGEKHFYYFDITSVRKKRK
jgi:hypothetical protein